MIDAQSLLADLKRLLRGLEPDLREEHANSEASRSLNAEWSQAREVGRTGQTFETFKQDALTQSAAHWILASVFLRFLEDNALVERPWLAGAGDRLHLARDRQDAHFQAHRYDSDRDYLLACFREAAALPGTPVGSSTISLTRTGARAFWETSTRTSPRRRASAMRCFRRRSSSRSSSSIAPSTRRFASSAFARCG
jgi:hypothetical protein